MSLRRTEEAAPYAFGEPYIDAVAIVTSDLNTNDATARIFSGIYVGGAGIVQVKVAGNDDAIASVPFTAAAGDIIPIRGVRVLTTGTTATFMVALYSQR